MYENARLTTITLEWHFLSTTNILGFEDQILGFDPEAGWDVRRHQYCYEEWFSLIADLQLSTVGITIGARVEQVPGEPPTNRIMFRNKERKETGVYCTHTVLYAGSADDALRFGDDSILQHAPVQAELDFLAKTGGPVQLPPGPFRGIKILRGRNRGSGHPSNAGDRVWGGTCWIHPHHVRV